MPEPVSSTAAGVATLAVAAVSTTAVTAFGIPLGLRADFLVAGLFGSLAAITILNTVPGTGDTWRGLVRTTVRRMCVAVASSLTAGYLTPMFLPTAYVVHPLQLGAAFVIGAFAQRMLVVARDRVSPPDKPGAGEGGNKA